MRARVALLLSIAGLVVAMVGPQARALTPRVKRVAYPAGCVSSATAVGGDGGLWLVCGRSLPEPAYVLKVGTGPRVTSFGSLPLELHGHGSRTAFGFPR